MLTPIVRRLGLAWQSYHVTSRSRLLLPKPNQLIWRRAHLCTPSLPTSFRLSSGYRMPALSFGTYVANEFDRPGVMGTTLVALKTGYRSLDTARTYGTEKFVGEAIRASRLPREEIFLTTKVYNSNPNAIVDSRWNSSHRYIAKSMGLSLQDFGKGIEYIDLLLLHCAYSHLTHDNIERAHCIQGGSRWIHRRKTPERKGMCNPRRI